MRTDQSKYKTAIMRKKQKLQSTNIKKKSID